MGDAVGNEMNGGDGWIWWMRIGTREPEPLLGRMRDPLRLERSRWFKPIRVD